MASSESQTTPLAIGQTWIPERGEMRTIIRGPDGIPGVFFLELPSGEISQCVGSFAFRGWIERTNAKCPEHTP